MGDNKLNAKLNGLKIYTTVINWYAAHVCWLKTMLLTRTFGLLSYYERWYNLCSLLSAFFPFDEQFEYSFEFSGIGLITVV